METCRALRRLRQPFEPMTSVQLAAMMQRPLIVARTGRTVQEFYSRLGSSIERRVNRIAHRAGLGPLAVCEKVQQLLGDELDREASLELLATVAPSWKALLSLRKSCSKLLKYALPSESALTQIDAFEAIMVLTTRYPGLRAVFLSSKQLEFKDLTKETLINIWCRGDLFGQTPDFVWYLHLAATCLADSSISLMVEETLPFPWKLEAGEHGLTVAERLVCALNCETARHQPI
ncbi:hypothetical protein C8F01DRAFT_157602 [Mycena amicta]|nr:hypothetical protein C8F01DRAFT_157602 [Mycena amicta]